MVLGSRCEVTWQLCSLALAGLADDGSCRMRGRHTAHSEESLSCSLCQQLSRDEMPLSERAAPSVVCPGCMATGPFSLGTHRDELSEVQPMWDIKEPPASFKWASEGQIHLIYLLTDDQNGNTYYTLANYSF